VSIARLLDNTSLGLRNNISNSTSYQSGDYNQNGKVDAADCVLWRKSPSTYGGNPAGYNTWRANFGQPPGSGSGASTAVSEPASLILMMLAAAGVYPRWRRNTELVPKLINA
jgi:hypothetical protein